MTADLHHILYLSDQLQDLEDARKAADNRLRSLTHDTVEGEKGGWFGKALPSDHPAVIQAESVRDGLMTLERQVVRHLERTMQAHPLADWVAEQRGVGLKTTARLLGLIGDPAWHSREDRPRSIGELFAFCGVAGPGMRRQKGQKLSYDARIKPKLFVIVDTLVRAGIRQGVPVTDWGKLYYDRKAYYATQPPCEACSKSQAQHDTQSAAARCTPAHIDAKAKRILMREVLRGLWSAAGGQDPLGTQEDHAASGISSPDSDQMDVATHNGHVAVG